MSKTGVNGLLLTEAKYINLSLHYLEQVTRYFVVGNITHLSLHYLEQVTRYFVVGTIIHLLHHIFVIIIININNSGRPAHGCIGFHESKDAK